MLTLIPNFALAFTLLVALPQATAPGETAVPDRAGGGALVMPQDTASSPGTMGATSPLPQRAPEARTMRHYWPVFAVLTATWIGIVAYFLMIGRRSRRLTQRLYELDVER